MSRILKPLALVGALALTAAACADPADGITANDSAARLDGDTCTSGILGSGGGKDCPPPPE